MYKKKETRHILETYGATVKRTYQINSSEKKWSKREDNLQYHSLISFFMSAFLPHGYPDSVSKDYLQYQLWDSIQAFASSITGSICTHAILKGVGVGDENASSIAATITWLLKDGVYMVGRIGFAWLQGTKLDSDCKKWRLFADILNDAAMFLDLISAYFHNYFLLIICISGLFKALVGVAGGCTRAALTQHQARKNNMADVSAKDSSQETFVNLIALLCSLIILPVVTKSLMLTWTLYFLMTTLHVFANYLAVKSVVMESLNEARFTVYANHYLKEGMTKGNFLSVTEVNEKESLFFFNWFDKLQINLGTSFMDVIKRKIYEEIENLLEIYKDCDYLLTISKKDSNKMTINIAFSQRANSLTYLEALYQACYIKYVLEHSDLFQADNLSETHLEETSRKFIKKTFLDFKRSLETKEFNINIINFNIDSWRASW